MVQVRRGGDETDEWMDMQAAGLAPHLLASVCPPAHSSILHPFLWVASWVAPSWVGTFPSQGGGGEVEDRELPPSLVHCAFPVKWHSGLGSTHGGGGTGHRLGPEILRKDINRQAQDGSVPFLDIQG